MNTGKKISELRLLSGLSQEALAERLHVSRSLVEKWEDGSRRPDTRSVEEMVKIFGVPADSIVERDGRVTAELDSFVHAGFDTSPDALREMLDAFLLTLGDTERTVFLRRYHFLDRPSEISEAFGLGKSQVRVMLHRLRKKLKDYLSAQKEKKQ